MEVIEKLQRSRPEIVHLFDEIVKAVPDGVYLTAVKQTGNRVELQGIAQSSTRVSTFMRNIDASEWLANPDLDVVQTVANGPRASVAVHAVRRAGRDFGRRRREERRQSRSGREAERPQDRLTRSRKGGREMSILDDLRALDTERPGRWPLAVPRRRGRALRSSP